MALAKIVNVEVLAGFLCLLFIRISVIDADNHNNNNKLLIMDAKLQKEIKEKAQQKPIDAVQELEKKLEKSNQGKLQKTEVKMRVLVPK